MSEISSARTAPPGLQFMGFSFFKWTSLISKETLRHDLIAGITGAVVAMPQGVAFAAIAGMPPEYGLYSGIVPAIIAALFGSSWHLVSGPTTAASVVLFSILSQHAAPGSADYVQLAITLTFMVGVIQFIMGIMHLGIITQFVSHSVITGFTAGAAILIATKQIGHFFGVSIPSGDSFSETWGYLFTHGNEIALLPLAVGLVTLVLAFSTKHFFPKAPYMLISLVVGSLLAMWMRASIPGASEVLVSVHSIPSSLPGLTLPHFDIATWRQFGTDALAVALLALTEAFSIARAIGQRSGQRIDGNQEFIGQGLSNLVGSFFSSYVATGSFNRSGINFSAGAKTPVAAILAGVLLGVLVMVAAPLVSVLPKTAMAAVLLVVAWDLIDFHHIARLNENSAVETTLMAITFFSTLFISLEAAILLGAGFSLAVYLRKTLRPEIVSRVPDPRLPNRNFTSDPTLPECRQLKLMRVDGSLYYGSVQHFQETLELHNATSPNQKHMAIIASGINFVDLAGASVLAEEAERYKSRGGGFYLVRLKDKVISELEDMGQLKQIGRRNLFKTKGDAISAIVHRLDANICQHCDRYVFLECASLSAAAKQTEGSPSQTSPGKSVVDAGQPSPPASTKENW